MIFGLKIIINFKKKNFISKIWFRLSNMLVGGAFDIMLQNVTFYNLPSRVD